VVAAFAMKEETQKPAFIGGRMRVAREFLGLSQQGLADQLGVSKRGIQDNETRNRVPGGDVINGFVRLGINANWLLTGDEPMLLKDLGVPAPALYGVEQSVPPSHLPSAQEAATPALDLHTLQTVIAMLEEELERKRARLDPARKAEVISLLYDEAAAEREEDARRSKVLRLLRLVA